MTARESIANYPSKVREYTNFAVRGIRKVVKECGPREAGSEAERHAQELMAKDLEGCCETVGLEEFQLAPRAFMAWVKACAVLGIAAALANLLGHALVSVCLLALAALTMVLEFILYKQFLDVFFPKKTSCNLVGVRKPSGEVKRRLILCGHADSAPEWRYTYYGYKWFHSPRLLLLVVIGAAVGLVGGLAASVTAISMGHFARAVSHLEMRGGLVNVMSYVQLGLSLLFVFGGFFANNKRFVDGANDNLTGCFTAMAAPKLMGSVNARLENTELVVLCTGGEESGLRGAKAFCKAHAEEYGDVETVLIAVDTMTDFDHMGIYATDLNSTVKHDPAVCAMMRKAANTAGQDLPYENLFFGASDAAAATQAGIRSALFAAMDPAPASYYHTRLDTVAVLQPKTVEACLDIVMETAYQFDETGLAPFEGTKVKAGKSFRNSI